MRERLWELTGLVKTRAKDTWDLLDQRGRGQEGVELGGELLDFLLVLVELLEFFNGPETEREREREQERGVRWVSTGAPLAISEYS